MDYCVMGITVKTVKRGEPVSTVLCCREVWWEWWDWFAGSERGCLNAEEMEGAAEKGVGFKHISEHSNQEELAPRLKWRTNWKWGITELFIKR